MGETLSSPTISTKLLRIAEAARQHPQRAFTALAHHIDIDWLREAYRRTRKTGASGLDGQTGEAYGAKLEDNLHSLHARLVSGRYRAPPVRRVHIPKGDGTDLTQTRPIGIPTFEDKVLPRAVAMTLEAIFDEDFLPCSSGFRPARSAHQALEAVRDATMCSRSRVMPDESSTCCRSDSVSTGSRCIQTRRDCSTSGVLGGATPRDR